MPGKRSLEQHIAVFGESGSGKTVLLSSFYGAMQEPEFLQSSLFHVVADDVGQGTRLHRNYLGMRDSARLPEPTRFAPSSYAFSVRLKDGNVPTKKAKHVRSVRLVWHDYPGEWFEQDVSGPEEAGRRVDTFRSLLRSDVALLLVDGQRLLDNAGEEERYLKSLFGNLRNALLSLKDDLLEEGKPLAEFPRIWVLALSKVDLVPDLDVFGFRDLIVDRANDDVEELRKVIEGLVESNGALSVGEDFVLLSSARFEANRIEVTKRVGLDLVLPLAAVLPLERHLRWAERKVLGAKLVEQLVGNFRSLVALLSSRVKPVGAKGAKTVKVARGAAAKGAKAHTAMRFGLSALLAVAELAVDQLQVVHDEAEAKRDYLTAVLTRFRLDLQRGEEAKALRRSER
jgi:hypothetical protein